MQWLGVLLGIVVGILFLLLLVTLACFFMAFYMTNGQKKPKAEFDIPPGKIYEPFREQMITWMKETRSIPCREYTVTAFDGLQLHGRFYEYAPGAPIELMFHGYRGNAERDLCGGVQRCFSLGYSVFIADLRACGSSQGHVISFGVNESRDVHTWVDLLLREFGPGVKIILTGISMGASTVLIAAGRPLPKNVVGVVADCGYSSAQEIICKVIRQLGLPAKLLYPFVRWGGRLFGGFDIEEYPPIEAVKNCTLPVLFIHGETDDFVPCAMSLANFTACTAPKALLTVPGAGHGLSYLVDRSGYVQALTAFAREHGWILPKH